MSPGPAASRAAGPGIDLPVTQRLCCSGCQRVIDVARPPEVNFEVTCDLTLDARPRVTITVGRVIVHRCQLCPDGEWR